MFYIFKQNIFEKEMFKENHKKKITTLIKPQFSSSWLQCYSNAFLMIQQNRDRTSLFRYGITSLMLVSQVNNLYHLFAHVYLQRKVHEDIVYMH